MRKKTPKTSTTCHLRKLTEGYNNSLDFKEQARIRNVVGKSEATQMTILESINLHQNMIHALQLQWDSK